MVVGVLLATLTARSEWRPPDQLTLGVAASGQAVVTAQLATPATGARVEIVGPAQPVVSLELRATTEAQTVVVPPDIAHGAYKVMLISSGSSLTVQS